MSYLYDACALMKSSYEDLAEQCQNFAVELLDQTRNMSELHTILNYESSDTAASSGSRHDDDNAQQLDRLARLKLAVKYEQKRVSMSFEPAQFHVRNEHA